MIVRERAYPHPVLASFSDDVTPNACVLRLETSFDADFYYLDTVFEYSSSSLSELCAAGDVDHAVHVECKRNFFRRVFASRDASQRVAIPASSLVGRVEVSGFIKAARPIAEYRISGAHSDYGARGFALREGDVVAVTASLEFDAYTDYDPLRRISSILTIKRSEVASEGALEVDTTDDRLIVTLSQGDYDRYTDLKGDPRLAPLLANQVVVPAIMHALGEMKTTDDEEWELDMSRRWFRSINKKLEANGLDVRRTDKPAVELTQLLLRLPLRRSLEGLLNLNPLDE